MPKIVNGDGCAYASVSLPVVGYAIAIGEELPPDVDVEGIARELQQFYGDRLTLVFDEPVQEVAPAPKRRRKG